MIRSFPSWLLGVSAFYLILPQLIFVGGWLQGPWGVLPARPGGGGAGR